MNVETIVAQLPVKRLNNGMFAGFTGTDEVELDAPGEGPILTGARHEFGTLFDGEGRRTRAAYERPIKDLTDRAPAHACGDFTDRTLATPLFDHGEHPEGAAIGERIVNDVHAPALGRARRCRCGPAVPRDVFPAPHLHASLQALDVRPATDTRLLDRPPLSSQQHPNACEVNARPGVCPRVNARPQRGLVIPPEPAIPGGSTELRHMTAPQAADGKSVVHPRRPLAALCGPPANLRSASVRMCLSRERSATRRVRRAGSSSSERSCRSSATPRWAYVVFRREKVASLTLICRHTSVTGDLSSTYRNTSVLSASVHVLCFMVRSLSRTVRSRSLALVAAAIVYPRDVRLTVSRRQRHRVGHALGATRHHSPETAPPRPRADWPRVA